MSYELIPEELAELVRDALIDPYDQVEVIEAFNDTSWVTYIADK